MKENIALSLGLDRPIIVFDLETTGLSVVKDRIVEFGYLKHSPDGTISSETLLLNPECPIPPASTAVHGISDADVAQSPTFQKEAARLFEIFKDSYYSGFNIARYDLPLLKQEFSRAGFDFQFRPNDIIDAKVIYHAMEPRTLSAAYKHYCGKEHAEAHDAAGDVAATAEIIAEQIKRYGKEEIKRLHEETILDFVDLEGKFYLQDGKIYFAFSKFKDRTIDSVAESDPTFLRWLLQADFSEDTKNVVRTFLKNSNLN